MTHVLTTRLDDDIWALFKQFLETNAITASGWFQAVAEVTTEVAERNDFVATVHWTDEPIESIPMLVARAQQVDSRRLRRSSH